MTKSPLKWAGGKGKLLPQIMSLLPKNYNRYIEPFAGGLSLFFRLQPDKALVCDINEELINFYTVLRDDIDELMQQLSMHLAEEEYYFRIRDVDRTEEYLQWSNAARAARFLYLNKTCFNGLHRVNSKGHFNVPYGHRKNPNIVDETILRSCSNILATAELTTGSYSTILNTIRSGDFVYLDPPYAQVGFTDYAKETFGEEEQRKLGDFTSILTQRGIYWAMSNSDVPLIREIYVENGLKINTITAARFINSKGDGRGKVKEVFITNYNAEVPVKYIWDM